MDKLTDKQFSKDTEEQNNYTKYKKLIDVPHDLQ